MLGSLVRVESYPNLFLHNPHVKDFAAVGCVPGVGCLAVGPVTNRVLPVAGGPPLTRREYSAGRSLISLNMGCPAPCAFCKGRVWSPVTAFTAKRPYHPLHAPGA